MASYRMMGTDIGSKKQGVACLFEASSDLEALAVFRILKSPDLKGGLWDNLRVERTTSDDGVRLEQPRKILLSREKEALISTHQMLTRALLIISNSK